MREVGGLEKGGEALLGGLDGGGDDGRSCCLQAGFFRRGGQGGQGGEERVVRGGDCGAGGGGGGLRGGDAPGQDEAGVYPALQVGAFLGIEGGQGAQAGEPGLRLCRSVQGGGVCGLVGDGEEPLVAGVGDALLVEGGAGLVRGDAALEQGAVQRVLA